MSERGDRFLRQAAWQRSRASLTWTEKIRLAGELRKVALALRAGSRLRGANRAAGQPPPG